MSPLYDRATAARIGYERMSRAYRRDSMQDAIVRARRGGVVARAAALRLAYHMRPCFLCGARTACGHREPGVEFALMGVR